MAAFASAMSIVETEAPETELPETQLDDANTQLDAVPEPPPVNDGKPWARLVGVGPTAEFGVFDLHERQVVVGNAKKNVDAPVRIDDPRIRCGLGMPRPVPSLPVASCAFSNNLCVGWMLVSFSAAARTARYFSTATTTCT